MYRRDRGAVQEFHPDELLYMRYMREHFLDGELLPTAIRSQLKQSVNRSRFSEAEDVLFSETGAFNGVGVVAFRVRDIPQRVEQPEGPTFVFFMRHEPEDTNYSHSEIWADHEERTGEFRRPSRTVSLSFRIQLCRAIRREQVRIEATR